MEALESTRTDLSRFSVGDYRPGPKWKVIAWYLVSYFFFNSFLPWPYFFKRRLLRLFGARTGKGLVIKTGVRIKNPWKLITGDNCWIGESVWIDNLELVEMGNNVCLSQGALLLTGNHDYTISDFPYRLGRIRLEEGVWIGAKSVVCPGVTCRSHAVLTVGSVATKGLEAWCVYTGNPALPVKHREIYR